MTYEWESREVHPLAPRGLPRAVRALLALTVAAFLVQQAGDLLTRGLFTSWLGLSSRGLRSGFAWQLLTYMFLHGGFFHLILNLLVLFFLGPETERFLGTRPFLALYLVSGLLGGVGWVLIESAPWAVCIGASGAVFGVLGAFAALFPEQPVTLLVFFVFPVTLRAWVLAVILAVMELMFLLSPHRGGVAYAAHLAGGVAGYLYALTLARGTGGARSRLVGAIRRRFRPDADPEADRERMDRLLDKIADKGLGSLTRRERDWLERASRGRSGRA